MEITFVCKTCKKDFVVSSDQVEDIEKYYNWKCIDCGSISPREGSQCGNAIWKCKKETVERRK